MDHESQEAAAVRRQLAQLVATHGPGILDDSRRVRAMLADSVSGAGAETNLIGLALSSGVPARLREAGSDEPRVAAAVAETARELERTSSVQSADARWAVAVLAEALGLLRPGRGPAAVPPHTANGVSAGPGAPGRGLGDLVVRALGREHVAQPGRPVTIGRDPDCTVVLDSPAVSRRHAQVLHGPQGWTFTDAGSTQGSHVRQQPVRELVLTGETEVVLGQGPEAVRLLLTPFGDAVTRTPGRQRPAPVATEIPLAGQPGGPLAGGRAPATEVVGAPSGDTLTVTIGATTRVLSPGDSLTIGREDDNDLVGTHRTVSRHHARIEHGGGAWRLRDLGSTSGTWLDGRRTSEVVLSGHQQVVLGDPTQGERVVTVVGPVGSGAPATPSSRARRVLLPLGAAALALAVVGGSALAWRTLDDPAPEPPPTVTTTSRDDVARATVFLVADGRTGSGVVFDRERGLILTNAHVAAPSAVGLGIFLTEFADEQPPNPKRIRVDVSDGLDKSAEPRFYATVVAVDGYLDVAVLQIDRKLSGAPAEAEDLADLTEVSLGSSADVRTSDPISFFGYPDVAESVAPTFTSGVVAGPVQDDRLDEFRAVINTTAAISPGNSGGPAVDESGTVVGVATWETFDRGGEAFSRIRPIDLARPVIDAAVAGEAYTSPWTVPGPPSAKDTKLFYSTPATTGAVTEGCRSARSGASPTAISVDYTGFPGGEHTDVAAAFYSQDGAGGWEMVAESETVYPTKLPRDGCMTLTFDTDLPPGSYLFKLGVGGDLRILVNDDTFSIE
ncbi:FHA domain-containing protein [Nocardioides terrigena]|uniref:FHA domain-containing protein n=1 Tax=Nocardioides terrigena TaxID=424797 RepID=UPI000D317DC8|nr:FHA domain-containing protein [Nocardioides terrigena]